MKKMDIRIARSGDARAISPLLGQLGYPNTVEFARAKIEELSASVDDFLLVAEEDGAVVGAAHLHLTRMLHESGRLGRVAALVVDTSVRRRGVGRSLMEALEERARESGCARMEVTSNIRRDDAHAFYHALGYEESPRRFVKNLE